MAEKKVQIDIVIKAADAARTVKEIKDSIVDLTDAMSQVGENSDDFNKLNTKSKELSTSLEKVAVSAKKADTNAKGSGKSVTSMAGDIAKGIGVVKLFEAGLGILTGALMKNQKVADAVAVATGALEIIMSKIIDVVTGVIETVSKSTNGFDALGKTVSGIITLAFTPLKLTFFSIKLAIQELQLAWEDSFFGGGDDEKIKQLNKDIAQTEETIVTIGEEAIAAGKKVAENIIPAIISVGDVVTGVVEGISEISVSGAIAQSKAQVQLQNTAILAEAEAKRLAEQYDRQAEKLRQIRDNDLLSIAERTKANDDLLKVLDEEENALLAQANATVASAQANYEKNKSIENQAALTNALAEKDAVLAKVEGLRSEQKQNQVNLTKEQIALEQSLKTAGVERATVQREFDTEQIKNEVLKLEAKQQTLIQTRDAELKLLEENKLLFAEGTQARADADAAYLAKKQEFDNKIIVAEKDLNLKKKEEINKENIAKIEAAIITSKGDFDARQALLDERRKQELDNLNLTAGEKAKIEAKYEEDSAKLKQEKVDRGFELAKAGLGALDSLNALFSSIQESRLKKGEKLTIQQQKAAFNRNKVLGALNAGISTAESIVKTGAELGYPEAIPFQIAAGITGAAQIALILSKKFNPESPTPDTGNPSAGIASAPSGIAQGVQATAPNSFALFGTAGGANNLGGGQIPQTVAVVLESDITTVQNRISKFRSASEI